MTVRELEPEVLNYASRRFLLGWRRGCFTLVVAIFLLILFAILPMEPLFSSAGLFIGLATGLWMGLRAFRQRVITDMICMISCVVFLLLVMYLATGEHASAWVSTAATALACLSAGLSGGRMGVRLAEAEVYFFGLYGKRGYLQTIIEAGVMILFAFWGLLLGRYFISVSNTLLYFCLLLLFAVIAYAVYLKFRPVIPLDHERLLGTDRND